MSDAGTSLFKSAATVLMWIFITETKPTVY